MAVPKKRTSKSKSRARKSLWMNKALISGYKSLSLAKSLITGRSTSFIYNKSLQDYI